jgi:hypothetical protein
MEKDEVVTALVDALLAAPKWYYHAETVDRRKLEQFMEEYCIWHNTVRQKAIDQARKYEINQR